MKQYEILNVKLGKANSMYCVTKYAICNFVLITEPTQYFACTERTEDVNV